MVASGSDIEVKIENVTDLTYTISDPMYAQNDTSYFCIGTNNEEIAVSNISTLSGNLVCWYSFCMLVCVNWLFNAVLIAHCTIALVTKTIRKWMTGAQILKKLNEKFQATPNNFLVILLIGTYIVLYLSLSN